MKYFILLIPLVALCYTMVRIYNILPFSPIFKWLAVFLGLAVFASMILSFMVGLDRLPVTLSTVIYEVTTSWLFILLYLFMLFILMDILRCFHILPTELLFNSVKGTLIVTGIIFVVFICGNIRYYHKYRIPLEIKTEKQLSKKYRIVMISDLHLGYHNQRKTLAKWIDMINKENPDFVLIAGDVIDISTHPINLQRSFEEFHRLNAPVYACLGNHEYISDLEGAKEFYKKSGITLLIDSCAVINDEILIVGRNDRSYKNRKTISQLLQGQNKEQYSILIDHQPYNLEQSADAGINFQFSGHTHYGQVFPVNLITSAIYEKAYGQYKKGNTDYYISSGLGIWGGKFRIGTKSEYVVAELGN
ncbi:MAG: metallophosphoesterase [Bacteroidales bacterium]|nr:metallophosphoesterase [Bacteroidales bacterium]